MNGKEAYKEMFLAEALEGHEALNVLLIDLEKDAQNSQTIEAIFRITHTLKGNARGMGFEDIAVFAHTLEDFFIHIKKGSLQLNSQVFNDLFKANDTLGKLIQQVQNPELTVSYKGLKRKLEVIIERAQGVEAELATTTKSTTATANVESTASTEEVLTAEQKAAESHETLKQEEHAEAAKMPAKTEAQSAKRESTNSNDAASALSFSDSVQVPVRKLDFLMNLVGELLIERDRISSYFGTLAGSYANEFGRLQRISSDLQYAVMDVRLVQVGFLFKKFYRVARDTAQVEQKTVDLILEGTETEIDRNILQAISDSLIHIVRNGISHGIETDEERKKLGKQVPAQLKLSARSEKDQIIIEVIDDGKGINPKIIKQKAIEKGIITNQEAAAMSDDEARYLIFESGFSSAAQVTAISGRGVGMDVVKKAMDHIGGVVEIESEVGAGSTIRLVLPSSMAVKDALLFEVDGIDYAIALAYTHSVVSFNYDELKAVGNGYAVNYQGKATSLIQLHQLFENEESFTKIEIDKNEKLHTIIVQYQGKHLGLVVDKLQQQKEIVEKPLEQPVNNASFLSGVTILGNGKVCLVLDVGSIVRKVFKRKVLHLSQPVEGRKNEMNYV